MGKGIKVGATLGGGKFEDNNFNITEVISRSYTEQVQANTDCSIIYTFEKEYTKIPNVFYNCNNYRFTIGVENLTTTGCTLHLLNRSNSVATSTINCKLFVVSQE